MLPNTRINRGSIEINTLACSDLVVTAPISIKYKDMNARIKNGLEIKTEEYL